MPPVPTTNEVTPTYALEQLFMYISNAAKNLAFDTFRARVTQLAPAAKEAIMTIAEELRAQGLKQGLEQGLEQGLARQPV